MEDMNQLRVHCGCRVLREPPKYLGRLRFSKGLLTCGIQWVSDSQSHQASYDIQANVGQVIRKAAHRQSSLVDELVWPTF